MSIIIMLFCSLLFGFGLQLILGQNEAPEIAIPDGRLRGSLDKTVGQNKTYYSYRGIPYAKKPINNLRFAAPEKNDPWTGTLDATRDKDVCTQAADLVALFGNIIGSEDCLYINVYTTDVNGSLPVMVWIHGGGFNQGFSTYGAYGPDYIIEKGVIYVSFNYRLGVFGFLSTEDLTAPGNWGLKDQILALKWVKENIKYFGGDPNQVTVFGHSAGAALLSYVIQSDLSKGLYNKAIIQSGTSLGVWSVARNARIKSFAIGVLLGIIAINSQVLIENLRKVDYKKLKLAENNVTLAAYVADNILAGLPFTVAQEPPHAGAVFTGRSHQQLSDGNFNKVPMIIGFTSNEGAVFQPVIDLVKPVLLQYELDLSRLPPYQLTRNVLKRVLAGAEIRKHFFGLLPILIQNDNLIRFITVDQLNRPIRETVNLISKYVNVYYYMFSYKGLLGDPSLSLKGVGHGEELRYFFRADLPSTEQDRLTREKCVTLWTNFAKTGNPTPTASDNLLDGVTWEPNTPASNTRVTVKYLNIDRTLSMANNPGEGDWQFYQGIYQRYGDPPYGSY